MGTLMEGFFECIDQYESELNGLRTSAAMREAIKQGFYPGGRTLYGFCKVPVEVRVGKKPRYKLAIEPREAEVLRTMYRLYITGSGAMKVAAALTALGFRTRSGHIWDKGAVIQTLQQSAAGGVVRWGVHHRGKLQPPEKWLALPVEPIVDAKTYALVKELCEQRRPTELPGRASAKPRVLTGLARCGLCGSSYQLETSGKSLDGSTYSYCYYNCRKTLRAGKKACPGFRVRVEDLDGQVLHGLHTRACGASRTQARLAADHRGHHRVAQLHPPRPRHPPHLRAPPHRARGVFGERIVITPKEPGGRKELAPQLATG